MEKREDWFSKRMEQEKEALYRAELENYSEKMVINREGRIVFINEKYAAELGSTVEQLEGQLYDEVISTEQIAALLDLPDYETPFNPHAEDLREGGKRANIFIRAVLRDDAGNEQGYMIYDGKGWLTKYRTLASKISELMDEYNYQTKGKLTTTTDTFVGNSPAAVALRREIMMVARTNATLLIIGETGSGKEVVANEVFRNSMRSNKPFVKLNCAALPGELIESELFGYEEGAFTGARRKGKKGLFEQADQGVIMLDEVNSLSLSAQAKLLRVLQEREIQRVGGGEAIPINVRVIACSNQSLEKMVKEGTFREDLYYRLNVLQIEVPPLRERKTDIPLFVRHFIQQCNQELGKHVDKVDTDVYRFLASCPWPGNVRQLQNWIERAMTTVWKNTLTLSNFYWIDPEKIAFNREEDSILEEVKGLPLAQAMDRVERELIKRTLRQYDGNKTRTAQALGISRQMLHRKIHQFKLENTFE